MRQLIRIFLLLASVLTSLSSWANPYQRFAHPGGDFILEYPSGWKLSPGLQTVNFFHPDNKEVYVRIGGFPLGKDDPGTAEEYVVRAVDNVALYGGHLDRKEVTQVSGQAATRLEYVEKHTNWGEAIRFLEQGRHQLEEVRMVLYTRADETVYAVFQNALGQILAERNGPHSLA